MNDPLMFVWSAHSDRMSCTMCEETFETDEDGLTAMDVRRMFRHLTSHRITI